MRPQAARSDDPTRRASDGLELQWRFIVGGEQDGEIGSKGDSKAVSVQPRGISTERRKKKGWPFTHNGQAASKMWKRTFGRMPVEKIEKVEKRLDP